MAQVKPNYQGRKGHGGGWINVYHQAAPPAGTDVSITVPDDEIWSVKLIRMRLTTSSQTATRTVEFVVDGPDGDEVWSTQFAAKAKDLTFDIHLAPYGFKPPDTADHLYESFPLQMVLPPGAVLRTNTTNLQTLDQFGDTHVLVERYSAG